MDSASNISDDEIEMEITYDKDSSSPRQRNRPSPADSSMDNENLEPESIELNLREAFIGHILPEQRNYIWQSSLHAKQIITYNDDALDEDERNNRIAKKKCLLEYLFDRETEISPELYHAIWDEIGSEIFTTLNEHETSLEGTDESSQNGMDIENDGLSIQSRPDQSENNHSAIASQRDTHHNERRPDIPENRKSQSGFSLFTLETKCNELFLQGLEYYDTEEEKLSFLSSSKEQAFYTACKKKSNGKRSGEVHDRKLVQFIKSLIQNNSLAATSTSALIAKIREYKQEQVTSSHLNTNNDASHLNPKKSESRHSAFQTNSTQTTEPEIISILDSDDNDLKSDSANSETNSNRLNARDRPNRRGQPANVKPKIQARPARKVGSMRTKYLTTKQKRYSERYNFPTRYTWDPATFQSIKKFPYFKDLDEFSAKRDILRKIATVQIYRTEEIEHSLFLKLLTYYENNLPLKEELLKYYECFPDRLEPEIMRIKVQYHYGSIHYERAALGPLHPHAQSYLQKAIFPKMSISTFPSEVKSILCMKRYWNLQIKSPYVHVFHGIVQFLLTKSNVTKVTNLKGSIFNRHVEQQMGEMPLEDHSSRRGEIQMPLALDIFVRQPTLFKFYIQSLFCLPNGDSLTHEIIEDLFHMIIFEHQTLECWLIKYDLEISLSSNEANEMVNENEEEEEENDSVNHINEEFAGIYNLKLQLREWIAEGVIPMDIILASKKSDDNLNSRGFSNSHLEHLNENLSHTSQIPWHHIFFLSQLLNLGSEIANWRINIGCSRVFESYKKKFVQTLVSEKCKSELQLQEFINFIVLHYAQKLVIAFDKQLFTEHSICLSTLTPEGGLLSKNTISSESEIDELLTQYNKQNQITKICDDYLKYYAQVDNEDTETNVDDSNSEQKSSISEDSIYTDTVSETGSVQRQKQIHEIPNLKFENDSNSQKSTSNKKSQKEQDSESEQIEFYNICFYNKPWDIDQNILSEISECREFQPDRSYSAWKYYLENYRDLFALNEKFHISTNSGTTGPFDERNMRTVMSSYWIYEDTIGDEILKLYRHSTAIQKLNAQGKGLTSKKNNTETNVKKKKRKKSRQRRRRSTGIQSDSDDDDSDDSDKDLNGLRANENSSRKRQQTGRNQMSGTTNQDSVQMVQQIQQMFLPLLTNAKSPTEKTQLLSMMSQFLVTADGRGGNLNNTIRNSNQTRANGNIDKENHIESKSIDLETKLKTSEKTYRSVIPLRSADYDIRRKRKQFFEPWKLDPKKRSFDRIEFSRNTVILENPKGDHTPSYIRELYKARIRYIFNEYPLLSQHNPGDEYIKGDTKLFKKLVRKLFPNKSERRYFINWLADLFQNPDERKVGTCLVLLSEAQGTGKSSLLRWILEMMGSFGRIITNLYEELFNNFTTATKNTFVTVIDDSSLRTFQRFSEDLKNLITADQIRTRELYQPEKNIRSVSRFVIVSNNNEVIKLERDKNRRFAMFEPSSELQGDLEFFKKFQEYSIPRNHKAVLLWLLGITIDKDWHPERSYEGLSVSLKRQLEASQLHPLDFYIYTLAPGILRDFQHPEEPIKLSREEQQERMAQKKKKGNGKKKSGYKHIFKTGHNDDESEVFMSSESGSDDEDDDEEEENEDMFLEDKFDYLDPKTLENLDFEKLADIQFVDIPATEFRLGFKSWLEAENKSNFNIVDKKAAKSASQKQFPRFLKALGIRDTRELAGDKYEAHSKGTFYRLDLERFAEKAKYYELEQLDHRFFPRDIKLYTHNLD